MAKTTLERVYRVTYAITNHKSNMTYTGVTKVVFDGLIAMSTISTAEDEILKAWYLERMGDDEYTKGVDLTDPDPLQHFSVVIVSLIVLEYNDEAGKPYPWTQG